MDPPSYKMDPPVELLNLSYVNQFNNYIITSIIIDTFKEII